MFVKINVVRCECVCDSEKGMKEILNGLEKWASCLECSVTRLDDLLNFGQLSKAFGNN